MCSPSTTQHNFCFFTIRIFENCMFKQILKLTNMYLFWKRCISQKSVEKEIYCSRLEKLSTNLAQLSTTFVFSKKQNGGAGKQMFFKIFSPNFHFFQKSFVAQFSTNLAQFSTTFVFWKNKMAVLTSWT